MSLAPGRRLGPYEIIVAIGAGGMGEVYRARDTRLHRDVAIKILPANVATDVDRRQRFEHEAQAAARLDHPNIASVFDVGVDEGVPFIVSELVHGQSLGERLHDGPLALNMVRSVGAQVAEALAAAHERGIVHRDVKPDNVLITSEGVAKVVDFGIAKIVGGADSSTMTVTSPGTAPGIVIGTASYMSPEQIRSDVIDHRSDIFSLGAVLYEMAVGARPFSGTTAAETMAAVLRDEPRNLDELGTLPPGLSALIMRCLDKRPSHRFQSARDLAFSLQTLPRSTTAVTTIAGDDGKHDRRSRFGLAVGVAVVALLGTGFVLRGNTNRSVDPKPLAVRQLTFDSGVEGYPNLSRDGSMVIYAGNTNGNRDIFLRDVGAREAINLTADSQVNDWQPALSADDRQIAFRSERDGGGVFIVARTGGPARRVTRSGFNPSWSPDGERIVTATESVDWRPDTRGVIESELQITEVATGKSVTLATADAVQPAWSPNGSRIAYWGLFERNQREIWTVAVSGGEPVRVTKDPALDWGPTWSADGKWLYFSSDRGGSMNLWRVRIDESAGAPLGEPEPVNLPASWVGHARVGSAGAIIYSSFQRTGNLYRTRLDANRKTFITPTEPITTGSNFFAAPQPSKDGRWLTFTGQNGTTRGVFVSTFEGKNIRPITGGSGRDTGVNWNPSSDRIMFYSSRAGRYQIFTVNRDGGELRQETDVPGYGLGRSVWSSDGRRVATQETVTLISSLFDLSTSGLVTKLDSLPDLPDGGKFSPFAWSKDDSRIVGESSKGGVVVYSLRDRSYRQLTSSSTGGPRWLPDDRSILFAIGDEFFVVDEYSGKQSRLGSADPPQSDVDSRPVVAWSISWDGQWLYRSHLLFQSDIWMATPQ
jgi:eukaryotic-like serine/threonine-protein kinase